jgi:hypothetical protein
LEIKENRAIDVIRIGYGEEGSELEHQVKGSEREEQEMVCQSPRFLIGMLESMNVKPGMNQKEVLVEE